MNKGTYIYDGQVSDVFSAASNILFDAVSHTLGRDGLNTAIPTSNGFLSIINDGKTILESLSSDDPAIKLALNTLKESSFATNQNAGDGTTTTAVIQHLLLTEILNHNQTLLDNGLEQNFITAKDVIQVRDRLLEQLPNYKQEVETEEQLSKVINVALGRDDLVETVKQAFVYNDLDSKHRPALVKTGDKETSVMTIDGVSLTPVEINPVVLRSMPVTLDEELNIIIINQNISRLDNAFTRLLEKIARSDKKTILLYTEIMPSVMDQLLFNIQEGSLHLVPIRLAYPLDKMKQYIDELSRYFNVEVIDDLNPYQSAYNNEKVFGKATGYIINKDSAVIKNVNTEYQSELLPSKSSVIQVGFVTYSQQEEDFRRIEDAIHSAYNALVSGYTIGAGYTMMCLSLELSDFPSNVQKVMRDVLSYIFNLMKQDRQDDEFISYCMSNVYDSYKVTEQVILNAFTVVAQVLSTQRLLVPYK